MRLRPPLLAWRRAAFLAGCLGLVACAGRLPDATPSSAPGVDTLPLEATALGDAPLRVRVYLPPGYGTRASRRWPVLYLNDGQDAEAVALADALRVQADAGEVPIVVAIDAPADRMAAYGFTDRAVGRPVVAPTRYGPVGANAQAYAEWLTGTLVPRIDARYRTLRVPAGRAVLGWSLGAASAFDLACQYPEVFGVAGAFSPSFWLATDRTDADAVQRGRIAQRMVDAGRCDRAARLFLAVGTDEDTDDRDGDGLNDALDDTRDLVEGWQPEAGGLKGLRQAGWRVGSVAGARDAGTAALYVLDGGVHRQSSWARMLPVFLRWAYPPSAVAPDRVR